MFTNNNESDSLKELVPLNFYYTHDGDFNLRIAKEEDLFKCPCFLFNENVISFQGTYRKFISKHDNTIYEKSLITRLNDGVICDDENLYTIELHGDTYEVMMRTLEISSRHFHLIATIL